MKLHLFKNHLRLEDENDRQCIRRRYNMITKSRDHLLVLIKLLFPFLFYNKLQVIKRYAFKMMLLVYMSSFMIRVFAVPTISLNIDGTCD